MRTTLSGILWGPVTVALGLAACDDAIRVGEPKAPPPPPSAAVLDLPPETAPAPKSAAWTRRSPDIPCTIWSIDEARGDDVVLGCSGGLVYRFDGVRATPWLELPPETVPATFGFVWRAPDGAVFAVAQRGVGASASSSVFIHDGVEWREDRAAGSARVTAFAGVARDDVWAARGAQLVHYDGRAWTANYTAERGEFRDCAFTATDAGYCVGDAGLAVHWDGARFTPLARAPWTERAEVFGVQPNPLTGTTSFVFGEPEPTDRGDRAARIAVLGGGGTFAVEATALSYFDSYDQARRRVGRASIGLADHLLVAPSEVYGGAWAFDPGARRWNQLCGAILAIGGGTSRTRVGGESGFFGAIAGADQAAVQPFATTDVEFRDLSVARDGVAWGRVRRTGACAQLSDEVVRLDSRGAIGVVPTPDAVRWGRGLSALTGEDAFTVSLGAPGDLFGVTRSGWRALGALDAPWSVWAARANEVWVGSYDGEVFVHDGRAIRPLLSLGAKRQIEEIAGSASGDVWMVARGHTSGDTNTFVYHFDAGALREWNMKLPRQDISISAIDRDHAWMSGAPARVWDGTSWQPLPFDASAVWARRPDEIWFSLGGDIYRYDGVTRELAYRGNVHIRRLAGAGDHAFAVGAGGLVVAFDPSPGRLP